MKTQSRRILASRVSTRRRCGRTRIRRRLSSAAGIRTRVSARICALAFICWRGNGECTFTDMQKIEKRGEKRV